METHETIGYIVLGIILALLIWRILLKGQFPKKASFLYIILALTGIGFIFTGAYYGGEMVYTHGVAVKAVPVTEEGTGHSHDGGSHSHSAAVEDDHHSTGIAEDHHGSDEEKAGDVQQPSDKKSGQAKIHRHSDGSEHVHDN